MTFWFALLITEISLFLQLDSGSMEGKGGMQQKDKVSVAEQAWALVPGCQ